MGPASDQELPEPGTPKRQEEIRPAPQSVPPPSPLTAPLAQPGATTGSTLHLDSGSQIGVPSGQAVGRPFRAPVAAALPNALGLGRALRPLAWRVGSRAEAELDESATVQRIAAEKIWSPVFRPLRGRWLDVALVVDEGSSMAIWRQTIEEFRRLLEHQGAFRDVQVWGLHTDLKDQVVLHRGTLHQGTRRAAHSPHELYDPAGRRLILVVSDCVSPAWYSPAIWDMLAIWHRNPLAIVQVLPERFWTRTVLGTGIAVRVHSAQPGAVNSQLSLTPRRRRRESLPAGLALPIVTLESAPLAAWARLLAGAGGAWVPGFLLPPQPGNTSNSTLSDFVDENLSAEDRVNEFQATASPLAFRLAGLLAAVPLNLHIMHIVRQVMLPEAEQVHLAEVFLSGLLHEIDTHAPAHDAEAMEYDFDPRVREELLKSVPASQSVQVFETISGFVTSQYGQALDFSALLKDPTAVEGVPINEANRAFAQVAAQVLYGLGGQYTALATRLDQRSTADQRDQLPDTTPTEAAAGDDGNLRI